MWKKFVRPTKLDYSHYDLGNILYKSIHSIIREYSLLGYKMKLYIYLKGLYNIFKVLKDRDLMMKI